MSTTPREGADAIRPVPRTSRRGPCPVVPCLSPVLLVRSSRVPSRVPSRVHRMRGRDRPPQARRRVLVQPGGQPTALGDHFRGGHLARQHRARGPSVARSTRNAVPGRNTTRSGTPGSGACVKRAVTDRTTNSTAAVPSRSRNSRASRPRRSVDSAEPVSYPVTACAGAGGARRTRSAWSGSRVERIARWPQPTPAADHFQHHAGRVPVHQLVAFCESDVAGAEERPPAEGGTGEADAEHRRAPDGALSAARVRPGTDGTGVFPFGPDRASSR